MSHDHDDLPGDRALERPGAAEHVEGTQDRRPARDVAERTDGLRGDGDQLVKTRDSGHAG